MDVINSVATALLEYKYPLTMAILLECIGTSVCQISKPDWFLETCKTLLEMPCYPPTS